MAFRHADMVVAENVLERRRSNGKMHGESVRDEAQGWMELLDTKRVSHHVKKLHSLLQPGRCGIPGTPHVSGGFWSAPLHALGTTPHAILGRNWSDDACVLRIHSNCQFDGGVCCLSSWTMFASEVCSSPSKKSFEENDPISHPFPGWKKMCWWTWNTTLIFHVWYSEDCCGSRHLRG